MPSNSGCLGFILTGGRIRNRVYLVNGFGTNVMLNLNDRCNNMILEPPVVRGLGFSVSFGRRTIC